MTRSHDDFQGDDAPRDSAPRELDAELAPVVEALRRMPVARPGAQARVVAAALGRSKGGAAETAAQRWRPSVGLTATAAAAVIAAAGLVLVGRARQSAGEPAAARTASAGAAGIAAAPAIPPVLVPPASSATPYSTAAFEGADAAADAPVLVPFVLRRPDARHVAVVGDFNGWNPAANALAREANGVWTATLAVTPGRHAFGYVVDDTLWVRDPRADTERDTDYGRDHSVIVVGRP